MRIDTQSTQSIGNADASRAASISSLSSQSSQESTDATNPDVVSLSAGSRLLDLAKAAGTPNSNSNIVGLTASVRSGTYMTDSMQLSKSMLSDHIRA